MYNYKQIPEIKCIFTPKIFFLCSYSVNLASVKLRQNIKTLNSIKRAKHCRENISSDASNNFFFYNFIIVQHFINKQYIKVLTHESTVHYSKIAVQDPLHIYLIRPYNRRTLTIYVLDVLQFYLFHKSSTCCQRKKRKQNIVACTLSLHTCGRYLNHKVKTLGSIPVVNNSACMSFFNHHVIKYSLSDINSVDWLY